LSFDKDKYVCHPRSRQLPALERPEESEDLILLSLAERSERKRHVSRFALVPQGRIQIRQGSPVVHASRARPAAPERLRAQLPRGRLYAVLNDAVSRVDVVQLEVSVLMLDILVMRIR